MTAPRPAISLAAIPIALFCVTPTGAEVISGTMVWDGIVKDNAIEATSIWTRQCWYWKIKKIVSVQGATEK